MSDENKKENKEQQIPFDTKQESDVKRTQVVKKPRAKSPQQSDDNTLHFDDAHSKPREKKDFDPSRDTAVLSKDNPMLRRALSHQADDDYQGTMTLGEKREVILLIRGMAERVVMQEGLIYKLGRFELGLSESDEIDLTPYGAMDRGVSRVHAQLHLENNHLYITDLASTNGTYVSGTRIEAETPTALRKGDEVLLGRLQVQILFR
jgi:FHA domain-containing protein